MTEMPKSLNETAYLAPFRVRLPDVRDVLRVGRLGVGGLLRAARVVGGRRGARGPHEVAAH